LFATEFDAAHGWVTNANGTDTATRGMWAVGVPEETQAGSVMQRGDVTSGSQAMITDGRSGETVGDHDLDDGDSTATSPAFLIPTNTLEAALSFDSYLAHLSNAGPDDFLQIEVIDGADAIVVYEVRGTNTVRAGAWESNTIDLSSFIGRTISLRVTAVDAGEPSLIEAGLDTVSVQAIVLGG